MRKLLFSALLLAAALPASAAVRFADWSADNIGELLAGTAAADSFVMVVITQPDWCPNCIRLDNRLLRNPEATAIAELTADWTVLEVLGYDEPDATFLADQGLGFLGTPTTLLLKPAEGDARLGEARRVAAIVGLPDDYLEQLTRASAGYDAIAQAQARFRESNDAASMRALADAYLMAGDADAARRVFQSLLLRETLAPEERREIALQAITGPTQRIENDYERALRELDAWASAFPEGVETVAFKYARAWSLLSLGRADAGQAYVAETFLGGDDPDMVASYLYLAFRDPTGVLLDEAEARARAAIERFPDQAARFQSAHGRLLRRQGRLAEAEHAFGRALALAAEDDPSRDTYAGQLAFVQRERAGSTD